MRCFINIYKIPLIISILLVIISSVVIFVVHYHEIERIEQEKYKTRILVESTVERRETRLQTVANAFIGFFRGSQFVTQDEFVMFSKILLSKNSDISNVFILENNTIVYSNNLDLIGMDYNLTVPTVINNAPFIGVSFSLDDNNNQKLILVLPINYFFPSMPNSYYKINIMNPDYPDKVLTTYAKSGSFNNTNMTFSNAEKDNAVIISKQTDIFRYKTQKYFELIIMIWTSEYEYNNIDILLMSALSINFSIFIIFFSINSTKLKIMAEKTTDKLAKLNLNLNSIIEQKTNEIHKSNEELKKHYKLQTEFINIASHELRTPIQPILSYLELIEKKLIPVDSALSIITVEAKRLQKLANDILDVSRIESKTLGVNFTKIRINELIRTISSSIKSSLKEGVSLSVDLDQSNTLTINADESRMSQVLYNLLSNAIKFTDKGTIQIKTNVSDDKSQLDIAISDTGGGIPQEIIPRLFEKFASKSVKETTQHGTGLGLFISKAIVESHGGKIIGYNNDIGGATFVVSIPINQR